MSGSRKPTEGAQPTKSEKITEDVVDLGLLGETYGDDPAIQDRLTAIFDQLPETERAGIARSIDIARRKNSTAVAAFSKTHNITTAEQSLLEALLAGRTVVDHAEAASISVNTARSHMRRLIEKTQAEGQLDLIRRFHAFF